MKVLLSLIFLLLGASTLQAQYDARLPDGRASALFIYHPKSKALLLFDGHQVDQDSIQNNVWRWDGKKWNKIIASGPGSRSLSAGALNTKTGIIQLFGGVGKEGYEKGLNGDVRSFDGSSWNEIKTNSIGTRDHHRMVFADHLNAFVVYGGQNEKRTFDSITWILKDNQFIPLDIPGPGMRYHFGMAYDPQRKKVVLYGGGKQNQRDELWEFDGEKWERISLSENPGKRIRHAMVYHEELKMVVLHGGSERTNGWTWGWDGKQWNKIAEDGPVGSLQALGYDPIRKALVAYGGSNDVLTSQLWELKDGTWKKISDNGSWKWVDTQYQKASN